jgi:hypothetical protein
MTSLATKSRIDQRLPSAGAPTAPLTGLSESLSEGLSGELSAGEKRKSFEHRLFCDLGGRYTTGHGVNARAGATPVLGGRPLALPPNPAAFPPRLWGSLPPAR